MTVPYDDLIVGGGLAGASCAALLAEGGRRVVLLERESRPAEKLCGEFLGEEALLYLRAQDIDVTALGAAPVNMLRLAVGEATIERSLDFTACGLSRRVLDAAMLARARAAGAEVRTGVKVESLTRADGGWRARLQRDGSLEAGAAFLATGKHDLRGWRRPPPSRPELIGFKQHWELSETARAELGGAVELSLFAGGYAGLAPIEGGRANLCLLASQARLDAADGRWDSLLAAIRSDVPLLDRRLDGATPCADRPLAVAGIPFGMLQQDGSGPWRLGDQAAVVPSFTGTGIAVALYSATLAASFRQAGKSADRYHRELSRALSRPLARGMRLSPLMLHAPAQRALSVIARKVPAVVGWGINATRLSVAS